MKEIDFNVLINKLNALMNPYQPWHLTKAQKEHFDKYGDKIFEGDVYFKREFGESFANNSKLSVSSMTKFLTLLFEKNTDLLKIADQIEKSRHDELIATVELLVT